MDILIMRATGLVDQEKFMIDQSTGWEGRYPPPKIKFRIRERIAGHMPLSSSAVIATVEHPPPIKGNKINTKIVRITWHGASTVYTLEVSDPKFINEFDSTIRHIIYGY
jgi:hypothetical protein